MAEILPDPGFVVHGRDPLDALRAIGWRVEWLPDLGVRVLVLRSERVILAEAAASRQSVRDELDRLGVLDGGNHDDD